MEGIKGWLWGVCFAAVACALLEMLYPSGNMQKAAKLVTSIFFLCALVVPVTQVRLDAAWLQNIAQQTSAEVYAPLEEKLYAQSLELAQGNVERLVYTSLAQLDVVPIQVLVTMEMTDEQTVQITKTEIWLSADDFLKAQDIKNRVWNDLALQVTCYKTA